jgi:hypothetical protein
VGPRDTLRINPFHAGCADERQPALHGDLGGITRMPLGDESVNRTLAHDVELLGDDRLDCGSSENAPRLIVIASKG